MRRTAKNTVISIYDEERGLGHFQAAKRRIKLVIIRNRRSYHTAIAQVSARLFSKSHLYCLVGLVGLLRCYTKEVGTVGSRKSEKSDFFQIVFTILDNEMPKEEEDHHQIFLLLPAPYLRCR